MVYSNTIRRIISALLLLVLALSITPVILLHNLAANHKDISYADKNQKGDQYSKAGINCNTIDFVAEAQFLNTFTIFSSPIPALIAEFKNVHSITFYSRHHFYSELRGPPVAAL